jgi:hypothetical protein
MSEVLIAIFAAALAATALSTEPRLPTEDRIAQAAPPVERPAPPAADDRDNNDNDRPDADDNDRDDD